MSQLKFRSYSQLPSILKAATRTRWHDAAEGDGWLYKTLDGALLDRIPDDSDIEAHPQEVLIHDSYAR